MKSLFEFEVKSFNATGSDWQIFSFENDTKYYSGDKSLYGGVKAVYDDVVYMLNEAVVSAMKTTNSKEGFKQAVKGTMYQLSKYGAADTEPRAFLNKVADYLYGEDE